MNRWVLLVSITLGGCRCDRSHTAPATPNADVARAVRLDVVATGLREPVFLTFAPGDPTGRLFVVEKGGWVRVLRPGGPGAKLSVSARPFLDVSARVSGASEQGLLGLAFHPRYPDTGLVYVNFTDVRGDTRVVELRISKDDPDRVDPATERELLFVKQPYPNHNGGHLAFGPDGKLYVGLGDGGKREDPHGNGQNRAALLGKMLRFDLDHGNDGGAPAPEILMLGLRNPWRYSFDRVTGDLYIADVGQDRFEEIDVVRASEIGGQNFGWNVMEGLHCLRGDSCPRDGFTPPVLEYDHQDGCSITGGYVYRGDDLPEIVGRYFYADYCSGLIRSFRLENGRAAEAWDWKPALDPENKLARLTSFGEDAGGELYLLSQDGVVYRFAPAPPG